MIVLETERLLLRHLEPADLDALAAIYADPEVTQHVGGPLTRQQTWEQWGRINASYLRRQFGLWAAVHKPTETLVGRVGLIAWNIEGREELEVAWLLAREHWGKGLATEAGQACVQFAFTRWKPRRLISLIAGDNLRSQRVAEKLGMRREREIEFRGGRPWLWSVEGKPED